MNIRFLSLADHEVDDAVAWYDEQAEGLGGDFLDELDRVIRLIRIYPLLATQIEPEIRRFLLARFPYSLIYGIDQETIVVIAVAPQHREPRYWAESHGHDLIARTSLHQLPRRIMASDMSSTSGHAAAKS
jgi:hypothetical protein